MTTREKIYRILAGSDVVVSGEKLSEALGISRVSVWKHIKGMVGDGIPVVSSPKGYRLDNDPDSLHPLGFDRRRTSVHYFRETGSTMDEALELARHGCPGMTVVVADRQRQGRGRMRREWDSAGGGLYFTIIVRPEIPVLRASLVNLAAALELCLLLQEEYAIQARLKWPNDILVDGKKICGLLAQMGTEGDLVEYLSIGIGLNVNNEVDAVNTPAVSMKQILGEKVPRREVLLGFLDRYERRLEQFDADEVIALWRRNNTTLGRQVRVKTVRETHKGKAVDIDELGGLILEAPDGSWQTVVHGDCFYANG